MISLICGILETKQMNIRKKKREANQETLLTIENKLMITRGEVVGGMG